MPHLSAMSYMAILRIFRKAYRRIPDLSLLTFMIIIISFVCFSPAQSTKWVGTWSTSPQLVEPNNNPPPPGLSNDTLRQILRVSIGGDTLRMRFSNEFSSGAVTLHEVHMAVSVGKDTID